MLLKAAEFRTPISGSQMSFLQGLRVVPEALNSHYMPNSSAVLKA